ncbi:hypothetical protein [Halobellus sp. H-GB7]|uniref:hypothetical protein n=1 Tax=Halobellus sp. H-GB7 TaxID=3069756 RepID=UPI0027B42B34|nr:hypothetical protein [Halobellus sp. H-GB7]MDQ2054737.1 hypothetical protein [Halobellus sp. H-GB7]
MSNSHRPFGSERIGRIREVIESPPASLQAPIKFLAAPVRFVSFWAAVALPFLYLPLLAGGLEGSEPNAFVALLAVNAVALVVGHSYHTDGDAR